MFKENMNSELYKDILYQYLVPFAAHHYDFNCYVHQDNDKKHTAKMCANVLEEYGIEWVSFLGMDR
jgi:hypothetical protein